MRFIFVFGITSYSFKCFPYFILRIMHTMLFAEVEIYKEHCEHNNPKTKSILFCILILLLKCRWLVLMRKGGMTCCSCRRIFRKWCMFNRLSAAVMLTAPINFKCQPRSIIHLGHPNTSSAKITVFVEYVAHDCILFEVFPTQNRMPFYFGGMESSSLRAFFCQSGPRLHQSKAQQILSFPG